MYSAQLEMSALYVQALAGVAKRCRVSNPARKEDTTEGQRSADPLRGATFNFKRGKTVAPPWWTSFRYIYVTSSRSLLLQRVCFVWTVECLLVPFQWPAQEGDLLLVQGGDPLLAQEEHLLLVKGIFFFHKKKTFVIHQRKIPFLYKTTSFFLHKTKIFLLCSKRRSSSHTIRSLMGTNRVLIGAKQSEKIIPARP